MPQPQKNSNANTKPVSRLVDFAPGQPDDFDCEWKRLRLAPWKYPNSKSGKYMTFLLIDIEPDPDSGFEPFTAPYTFGFLNRTMPSNDGETPLLDEDRAKELAAEGNDSLDQSEIEQFEGTTFCGAKPAPFLDWPELADSIQTCGMSYEEFPEGDFSGFEGMKCHMNRLPVKNQSQKKSTGANAQQNEWKVLKVTEIHAKPGEKSSKGKTNANKATTKVNGSASSSANSSDLESRVRDVLVEALRNGSIKVDEKTGTVKKDSAILRGKVTTQGKFNKDGQLKPTVEILNSDAFHEKNAEEGLYLYDSETGEITPLEE